jgi:plasmid stabilization system protein ParE
VLLICRIHVGKRAPTLAVFFPFPCGGCVLFIKRHGLKLTTKEIDMPKGDKSAYTDKQKRKAEHIEEGYEDRGVDKEEAERRAWATVNKESGGGNKSGSGRGKAESHESSRKGGRLGGSASSARTAEERSASARKAAATRKRNAAKAS